MGLWRTAAAAVSPEAICSQTTSIFCDGFESGTFSLWDDYDGNPAPWNTTVANVGPINLAGNHVALMRVPEGRGGTDLTKVLPSQHDKLYVRWYMKWEAGYDFAAPNHGSGFHAGNRNLQGHSDDRPTGADWFSAWLEPQRGRLNLYVYYRGMYQDCQNPDGQCWGDHFPCYLDEGTNYCKKPQHREHTLPPLLVADKWYCVEMMMDGGTPTSTEAGANGAMNLWIDNTEYGPWNDLWFRTTSALKISLLQLGIFHHGEHSVAGAMYDNVVVSKNRVGCLASKTPNPPTDLRTN